MTGYGRAELVEGAGRWSVELRSVNHRYAEISLRLPRFVQQLENRARALIQDRLARGKITASVAFEGQVSPDAAGLRLDLPLLDRYHQLLLEVKERYRIQPPPDLRILMALPDILIWDTAAGDDEGPWASLERLLDLGCREIIRMKEQEGAALLLDLKGRLGLILREVEDIEARVPIRVEEARKKLSDRLSQLLDTGSIDPNRLAQEVAVYVDRMDSTEECVRLRAHCAHFSELLEASPSAGRKLNFLIQEMHREANTIGSKATDPTLSQRVLLIKEELEKIREQIQNIE